MKKSRTRMPHTWLRVKSSFFRWWVATTALLYGLDLLQKFVYNWLHHSMGEAQAMWGMRIVYTLFVAGYCLLYWKRLRPWIRCLPIRWVRFFGKYRFWKWLGWRTGVISVCLVLVSQFNLIQPWFVFYADFEVLVMRVFTNPWDTTTLWRGQTWQPAALDLPLLQSEVAPHVPDNADATLARTAAFDRVISRAAWWHDVPEYVLFSAVLAESDMRLGCLPQKNSSGEGGSELGPSQIQGVLAEAHMHFTLRLRECYMDKSPGKIYLSHMDRARAETLVYLAGVDLPWSLDLVRYYFISSIDDRMGLQSFRMTAKILREYYELAGKEGFADEQLRWLCAMAKWRTNSFSPVSRSLVQHYPARGKQYVQWKKSLVTNKQLTLTNGDTP